MEARAVETLPQDPGWRFEPKWDGFRCLAFAAGGEVELRAKSGKSLSRYFPDMVRALAALPGPFVVDGELAIPVGEGLSFEALQLRLHPAASRVEKLARESPAILIAFDMLVARDGKSLVDRPLAPRRQALERWFGSLGAGALVRLSPGTDNPDQARLWLERAGGDLDGVIAKRLDEPYRAGERAMLKVKRWRTVDCVVGGFRYLERGSLVGALLLGLYDDAGSLHHVGFTSAIHDDERPALTNTLEALIEPPGFTGAAPGGPSRWRGGRALAWSPLRPELVAEVRYDHASGARLRHGAGFVRWRPDKAPRQCRLDQLQPEARPVRLLAEIGA